MKNKVINLSLTCIISVITVLNAFAQNHQGDSLAYYLKHAPFKMPVVTEPRFASKTFNVKDYGAIGDGQALNTEAFEKAIATCSTAGGGTVLIPAGLWLTGPIELKSNVNLHTAQGALVIFSTDHSLFPILMPEGRVKSPLYGNHLENIAITGDGIFDGGGDTWRPLKKSKAAPTLWNDLVKSGGAVSSDGSMWWPTRQAMEGEAYLKKLKGRHDLTAEDYLPARDFMRPTLVSISNSKNILIDGPTFKNSPQYVLNPRFCTNMIIQNVHVINEYYAQNGDGIDLSSCKNSIVYHCTVNAGDDGICMKSSGSKGDSSTEAALQYIVIADCVVYHAHGGFVIGSNTDGGMQNVYVTNCNFVNTDIGIRIKSARGRGGLVHDIYIENIYMHDILNEAILFNTYYEESKGASSKIAETNNRTPRFRDFYIRNVYCNNAKIAIDITGLPEMPVNHINLSDIVISADAPFSATDATDISLKNVKIISPMPTLITLNNTQNITADRVGFGKNTLTLISAKGINTKGIKIINTDLKSLPQPVKLDGKLSKDAVSIE
jgi:polygalacturonase